ncbi:peptide chain release factor 1 [Microseira sp. BLCC-F43]|uniref:peptide chain release factor 1 n=1 Tax=Microseira sp. BLCC-F43 TaxID=3153602 RepID=UPI0035BA2CD2
MNDPLRSLKLLPWRSLLKYAAITTAIATAFDLLLLLALVYLVPLQKMFLIILAPPLGILIAFAVALGIGALAVYLTERQRNFILNTSNLWALVACLILCFWIKSLLPIPSFILNLSELTFVGIILGVFWKGRPYWR